jgi:four helix bundle protein
MAERDLKVRTKPFALRALKVVEALPETTEGRVIGYQLAKAGTSTAANYRAACRARSRAEFIAKLGTVMEEADETAFWLERIMEGKILPGKRVNPLWNEASEIVAVMTQSQKTAKESQGKSGRKE